MCNLFYHFLSQQPSNLLLSVEYLLPTGLLALMLLNKNRISSCYSDVSETFFSGLFKLVASGIQKTGQIIEVIYCAEGDKGNKVE